MKKPKTNIIAAIVITAMIVYGAISLASTLDQVYEAEAMTAQLKAQIDAADEENENIICLMEYAETAKAKKELARERLGLVDPGEVVFVDAE